MKKIYVTPLLMTTTVNTTSTLLAGSLGDGSSAPSFNLGDAGKKSGVDGNARSSYLDLWSEDEE